jgi:hypothetical protein
MNVSYSASRGVLLRAVSAVRCFLIADGDAVSGAQDGGQLLQRVEE